MYKNLFVLMLLIFPGVSQAGWTKGWGKITEIMSHDGKHIIYTTIEDKTCGGSGNFWWPTSDPDAKDMFALAMAAFMGEKEVMLVHRESVQDQECQFGHISKATHIRIR
ncbi:hypothetical protein HG263_16545 [Pseudoalteromonas sp. JBTF-M23]|uniref:Uncharacterized protein n=1 Tax=Pseudoalteromonas caenipelagi TaxID=2726988 RepID=A0A849VH56_9GAMM|nr:hypothetical protein [Pseudoalteromonas caenipelagi]NOU52140.1 hypothetical protein [Pseudoalteromonas caenipelagi]